VQILYLFIKVVYMNTIGLDVCVLVNRYSIRKFPLTIMSLVMSHEKEARNEQTNRRRPNQLKNSKSKNRLKKKQISTFFFPISLLRGIEKKFLLIHKNTYTIATTAICILLQNYSSTTMNRIQIIRYRYVE
jgi:hypothetical protein